MTNELMITVERVVRPLRAAEETRFRLRNELLAHIQAIHAEELAAVDDASAALRRTIRRFGQPDDLRQELQHSLTWSDRFTGWMSRCFLRQRGESPVRFGGRAALLMLGYILLVPVVNLVPMLLTGQRPAGVPVELLGLIGMLIMDAFVLGWLSAEIHDRCCTLSRPIFRQPSVWLSALMAGAWVLGLGLSLQRVISVDSHITTHVVRIWLLIGVGVTLGFVGILFLYARDWQRRAPWEMLDLNSVE